MEEMGLSEKLFQTGFEPTGRKRINNYFTLRWVEIIKTTLDKEYIKILRESQFKNVMRMGGHIFSVIYGLSDFAEVTGLNCGLLQGGECSKKKKKKQKSSKGRSKKDLTKKERGPMWEALFGDVDNPTPSLM
ncbi:unnamed protein product [Microthlaspi erraticum]|uniref:DUF1985 domain-containing protein n=1 Tax=Microthlaspi erraticum TaxID=1685480 RepID=A0A6D2HW80_9BRAS|nr:unnamed protein product [Microthlaspi erraticum]